MAFLKSCIETKNRAFNRLIEDIERVALRSREPILLTGPTGAGESQLVRLIFELERARRLLQGPPNARARTTLTACANTWRGSA